MIWVVVGFVLLVSASVGFFVVSALRKVGRFTGRRAKVVYGVCYLLTIASAIALSNDEALGPFKWWLPIAVFAALAAVVGLPLHFWEKRQLARSPRDDSWTPS